MIPRLILVAFVLCLAAGAQAQDASPVAPPAPATLTPAAQNLVAAYPTPVDPAKLAIATDIVKRFDSKNTTQTVLGVMMKAVVPLVDQANPGQEQKIHAIVLGAVQKTMLSHMDEMDKNNAIIYAELFSIDDLNHMRDFYASPTGQKMIKLTPDLVSRSLKLNQAIIITLMHDANQQIIEQLKDNGMKVPQGLGI